MPDNHRHVAGALLGLHALTSLHPGSGTALGTVDLPVQRERHTGWPTIAGSALKGVLRDACRTKVAAQSDLDALPRFDGKTPESTDGKRKKADATLAISEIFGPPTQGSDEFGGALNVTDARILAFPVRSLKGVFAWVSCNGVLDRLKRDVGLAQPAEKLDWTTPKVDKEKALVPEKLDDCPCTIDQKHVVLEEFEFSLGGVSQGVARWIAGRLFPQGPSYDATRARFQQSFLILHDDDFTHFARHATEVSARIGLNYETKTVRDGALFYQEFLPPETLFYSVVLANPARSRNGSGKDAADILGSLAGMLPEYLQIGGDETTGKGLCAVALGKGA